jgi:hypothetical protein
MIVEISSNTVVRAEDLTVKTDRKWQLHDAVEEALEILQLKEIRSHTQTTRRGFVQWWSKASNKGQRDMAIWVFRGIEESKHAF